MYITNTSGCASNGTWETYATSKNNWALGQTNATATVYVKYRDAASNESACINDTIVHDDQAPTSPSITISSGAAYTISSSVSLSLSASGASDMYVTNTSGCGSGGSWETYATTKPGWGLGQSNATATVYIKYKDEAANESSCVSDTILHDNVNPSDPTSFVDAAESRGLDSTSPLTWGASTDGGSGLSHYEVSVGTSAGATDVKSWTNVGTVLTTMATGLTLTESSTYYANIRSVDLAGNTSNVVSGDGFTGAPKIVQLDAGYFHQCARFDHNKLKCWGYNVLGGLGKGTTSSLGNDANEMGSNLTYIDLGTNRTAKKVIAGAYFNCAILDNDLLKCWGHNAKGQLGKGNVTHLGDNSGEMGDSLTTIDLGTNRTVLDAIGGYQYTCVLLDNSKVKCFGNNSSGRLGIGSTANQGDGSGEMGDNLAYTDLGTNRTATKIFGGYSSVCAILDNDDLKCWGYNNYGQLGKGNTSDLGDGAGEMGDNLTAVDLGTNRTAVTLEGGQDHYCAILDNDDLKCWGRGAEGQLGAGNTLWFGNGPGEMGDNLPVVDLGTNRTATQVGTGYSHSCALLDNGQVKCWGSNSSGKLGVGDTVSYGDGAGEMGDNLTAVDLGTNRTAIMLDVGYDFNCALLDNYDFKCWGSNTYGQLGQEHANHLGDGSGEMGDNLTPIDL